MEQPNILPLSLLAIFLLSAHSSGVSVVAEGPIAQSQFSGKTLLFYKEVGYLFRGICRDGLPPTRRNCPAEMPKNTSGFRHSHSVSLVRFRAYWGDYDPVTANIAAQTRQDLRQQIRLIEADLEAGSSPFSAEQLRAMRAQNHDLLAKLDAHKDQEKTTLALLDSPITLDVRPSILWRAPVQVANANLANLLNAIFSRLELDELSKMYYESSLTCTVRRFFEVFHPGFTTGGGVAPLVFVPPGVRESWATQTTVYGQGYDRATAEDRARAACPEGTFHSETEYRDLGTRITGRRWNTRTRGPLDTIRRSPRPVDQQDEQRFPY